MVMATAMMTRMLNRWRSYVFAACDGDDGTCGILENTLNGISFMPACMALLRKHSNISVLPR